MKKVVYACILFVLIIIAFVVGVIVGKCNHSKDGVVGVYQTESWNGEIGTLVFDEDGTCQYPSGENAKWELDGSIIQIKCESSNSIQNDSIKGLVIYIDTEYSEEKRFEILESIQRINNIKSVEWMEETNSCKILLTVVENDNKTFNELSKLDGVTIMEKITEEEVSVFEYEAKIMEKGLMLNGHFFKKVSN